VKKEFAIILVGDHFPRSFCFFHFFSLSRDHFGDHFGGALFFLETKSSI